MASVLAADCFYLVCCIMCDAITIRVRAMECLLSQVLTVLHLVCCIMCDMITIRVRAMEWLHRNTPGSAALWLVRAQDMPRTSGVA